MIQKLTIVYNMKSMRGGYERQLTQHARILCHEGERPANVAARDYGIDPSNISLIYCGWSPTYKERVNQVVPQESPRVETRATQSRDF